MSANDDMQSEVGRDTPQSSPQSSFLSFRRVLGRRSVAGRLRLKLGRLRRCVADSSSNVLLLSYKKKRYLIFLVQYSIVYFYDAVGTICMYS